jgi:DNA-binding transcriptional ArsR family regulator
MTHGRRSPTHQHLSAGDQSALACLRWCGFVTTHRQHRVVYYRLADPRVAAMLELAHGLLDDHADHVAACCRIPDA